MFQWKQFIFNMKQVFSMHKSDKADFSQRCKEKKGEVYMNGHSTNTFQIKRSICFTAHIWLKWTLLYIFWDTVPHAHCPVFNCTPCTLSMTFSKSRFLQECHSISRKAQRLFLVLWQSIKLYSLIFSIIFPSHFARPLAHRMGFIYTDVNVAIIIHVTSQPRLKRSWTLLSVILDILITAHPSGKKNKLVHT